jgi:peptide methionine sulfoxide reductase MsrB
MWVEPDAILNFIGLPVFKKKTKTESFTSWKNWSRNCTRDSINSSDDDLLELV